MIREYIWGFINNVWRSCRFRFMCGDSVFLYKLWRDLGIGKRGVRFVFCLDGIFVFVYVFGIGIGGWNGKMRMNLY